MKKGKKLIWFIGILWAAFWAASCTEEAVQDRLTSSQSVLKLRMPVFSSPESQSALAGEEEIRDVRACLFEAGKLTAVYSDLVQEADGYVLPGNKRAGHLYLLANTAGWLDLQGMEGLAETDWRKLAVHTPENDSPHFFTGMVDLDKQAAGTASIPVSMKRGVLRFDLLVRMDKPVSVTKVTWKKLARQAYLFPQDSVQSPGDVPTQDISVEFTRPLQRDSLGVLYAFEQADLGQQVVVEMQQDGKTVVQQADLPAVLKRNAVYTLTLRKDQLSADVKLEVAEWENGGDSSLYPQLDSRIQVMTDSSELPAGVEVNPEKNRLVLPYTALDFTVSLACEDELELVETAGCPLTVERLPDAAGQNRFRLVKEHWRIGVSGEEVKVQFRRKGLQAVYPDDCLTLVLSENPTSLTGLLDFRNGYSYDFGRYIDNELAVFTLPEGKDLRVEYEDGEDPWLKLDAAEDNSRRFRVLAGWKPNDPTADGREQKARLVILDKTDENVRETYTVARRNWGLPVTYLNGIWWCKYNAMGDSRNFSDQILSSADPAVKAGKTLFDYLRDCSAEEYFRLWKWEYQGDSGQGLPVTDDNGVAKLAGYNHNNGVHINKLEPGLLAPAGYEIPSMDDFNRVFASTSGNVWLMWDGSHKTAWNGETTIQRRQRRRDDVAVGSVALPDLIYIAMYNNESTGHEPVVWYGPAAQWNHDGIYHGHYNNILFAVYSPQGEGWFFSGGMNNLYLNKNGAGARDTRILRFKKSPVEYIYE